MREKNVIETVMAYRNMEERIAGSSTLREIRVQYEEMSNGGDGGSVNGDPDSPGKSIREEYYPSKPDEFFQEVCDLMGWYR